MMKIKTIYIDVLFAVNFIINMTILNIEAIVLKLPVKLRCLLLGSAAGALYSCLAFTGYYRILSSFAVKASFALLITLLTFGKSKPKPLLKRTAVFFLLTVFFAITVLAVLYFTDIGIKLGGIIKNGVFYFNIPLWYMFVACVAASVVTVAAEKLLKHSVTKNCVKIKITYRGKTAELTALIDTGNTLTDPFNGKKVMVAEARCLSCLFDFDIPDFEKDGFETLPPGFRLIPFNSVGNSKGLLAAFVPDMITADQKIITNLTTAIYCGTLCQSGDYNALVGPIDVRKDDTNAQRENNYHNTEAIAR